MSNSLALTDTTSTTDKLNKMAALAMQMDATGVTDPQLRIQVNIALSAFTDGSPASVASLYSKYVSRYTPSQLLEFSIQSQKNELRKRMAVKNYPLSYTTYELANGIASYYFVEGPNDTALYYYNIGIESAKAIQSPVMIASSINNIGILMSRWGKDGQAAKYFASADSCLVIRTKVDSLLHGSITDNRAQLAIRQKNWATAGELYKNNLALYGLLQNPTKVFQAQCGLLNLALQSAAPANAKASMAVLSSMLAMQPTLLEPDNMNEYFLLAQQYYRQAGNYPQALLVANLAKKYTDSVGKAERNYLGGKLQDIARSQAFKLMYETGLYQQNLAITRSNGRKSLLITILGASLTVALLVFVIIQFRSRHKIQQGEIERRRIAQQLAEAMAEKERLEKQKIHTELVYSKKDLSDFAQHLSQQRESYNEMVSKLALIKRKDNEGQAKDLHRLAIDAGTKIQVQEKATLIQENVEKINTAFSQKLLEKYPSLTKGEAELCGFIRLNMSNKEIGVAKNITPDSIKRDRNRLRNKLGLPPEEDMVKLLGQL